MVRFTSLVLRLMWGVRVLQLCRRKRVVVQMSVVAVGDGDKWLHPRLDAELTELQWSHSSVWHSPCSSLEFPFYFWIEHELSCLIYETYLE
jgi:hypothetical protein